MSQFFHCARGVRQGENLSHSIFLFLNDVEHFLSSKTNLGVVLSDEYIDMYLKLLVILYADDTVTVSKTITLYGN